MTSAQPWTPARALCTGAAVSLAALVPCTARADPMRPLHAPTTTATATASATTAGTGTGSATAPAALRGAAGDTPPPQPQERLIAIRQDSTQRWQALVGERWLAVGQRLGGATVTAIDLHSVQLADRGAAGGRRTLHLLPPLSPPASGRAAPPPLPKVLPPSAAPRSNMSATP